MSPPAISCIILAGGQAKRFDNIDKGTIVYQDKPLIQHVVDAITHQVDDIVISANRNHSSYKQFSDHVISDSNNDYQGPLSGIEACLSLCKHDLILVVPCDMPFLPETLVKTLMTRHTTQLTIAEANDRDQLVFLMDKKLQDSISQCLEQGKLKLMRWIETQNPVRVSFDSETTFSNINSQLDLDKLNS